MRESQKLSRAKAMIKGYRDPALENRYFIHDTSAIWSISNEIIPQVYFAGYWKNYFYAVLEYIDGITLIEFLAKKDIPFGVKYKIAHQLNKYHAVLMGKNIVHSDFHPGNIMISNIRKISHASGSPELIHTYDLSIIDFGTSVFVSNHTDSKKRPFETLIYTIDNCISPFKLRNINASPFPDDITDGIKMEKWINQQLYALRAAFFELGQECVGWPLYRQFGTYRLTTDGFGINLTDVKKLILEKVHDGIINLNEEFLGISEEWDKFDGRYAKRGD